MKNKVDKNGEIGEVFVDGGKIYENFDRLDRKDDWGKASLENANTFSITGIELAELGNKPIPKYKIFTAYWWNPFFWIGLILMPIWNFIGIGGIAFLATLRAEIKGIKHWNLK
jgi:hypothetical protein